MGQLYKPLGMNMHTKVTFFFFALLFAVSSYNL